jgi:CrcB protein
VERDLNVEGLKEGSPGLAPSLQVGAGQLAAVFAGGSIGALARAALAQSLTVRAGQWPWATFSVNVFGAFLLGGFLAILREHANPPTHLRSFLAVGVCGALTTFSTMMLELLRMIDGAHWLLALAYTTASIGCGYAAVHVSGRLFGGREPER